MNPFLESLGMFMVSLGISVLLLGLGRGLEGLGQRKSRFRPIPMREWEDADREKVPPALEKTTQRVLAAVRAHPKGIRLVDIGKEIGIDWHLLIAPINLLLHRRLIRKRDRVYFPSA